MLKNSNLLLTYKSLKYFQKLPLFSQKNQCFTQSRKLLPNCKPYNFFCSVVLDKKQDLNFIDYVQFLDQEKILNTQGKFIICYKPKPEAISNYKLIKKLCLLAGVFSEGNSYLNFITSKDIETYFTKKFIEQNFKNTLHQLNGKGVNAVLKGPLEKFSNLELFKKVSETNSFTKQVAFDELLVSQENINWEHDHLKIQHLFTIFHCIEAFGLDLNFLSHKILIKMILLIESHVKIMRIIKPRDTKVDQVHATKDSYKEIPLLKSVGYYTALKLFANSHKLLKSLPKKNYQDLINSLDSIISFVDVRRPLNLGELSNYQANIVKLLKAHDYNINRFCFEEFWFSLRKIVTENLHIEKNRGKGEAHSSSLVLQSKPDFYFKILSFSRLTGLSDTEFIDKIEMKLIDLVLNRTLEQVNNDAQKIIKPVLISLSHLSRVNSGKQFLEKFIEFLEINMYFENNPFKTIFDNEYILELTKTQVRIESNALYNTFEFDTNFYNTETKFPKQYKKLDQDQLKNGQELLNNNLYKKTNKIWQYIIDYIFFSQNLSHFYKLLKSNTKNPDEVKKILSEILQQNFESGLFKDSVEKKVSEYWISLTYQNILTFYLTRSKAIIEYDIENISTSNYLEKILKKELKFPKDLHQNEQLNTPTSLITPEHLSYILTELYNLTKTENFQEYLQTGYKNKILLKNNNINYIENTFTNYFNKNTEKNEFYKVSFEQQILFTYTDLKVEKYSNNEKVNEVYIEIDGSNHFNMINESKELEITSETKQRNTQFLMLGRKVITISTRKLNLKKEELVKTSILQIIEKMNQEFFQEVEDNSKNTIYIHFD